MMNQISLDWDTLKAAYPMRPLTGALKAFMDQLGPGNTPCCVQMSHALGVAGCLIGERSNRRANSRITTPTGTRYYLLAVDEMKWFLEDNFGMGDEISAGEGGGRRSRNDMKTVLEGRTGILVFSNLRYGTHTELWDGNHMHQRDMSPALFDAPKVLFWDVMITAQA
jgi:type VI secretion system (T6SS) effector Tae4 (amidase)